MEAGGIEPPRETDATDVCNCVCENLADPCAANALHSCGSNCHNLSLFDAELQLVILAWNRLPMPIRNAIMGLVHSQEGSEQ
jgi:hypothetical protein